MVADELDRALLVSSPHSLHANAGSGQPVEKRHRPRATLARSDQQEGVCLGYDGVRRDQSPSFASGLVEQCPRGGVVAILGYEQREEAAGVDEDTPHASSSE